MDQSFSRKNESKIFIKMPTSYDLGYSKATSERYTITTKMARSPDKRGDGKHTCNPDSWVRPPEGWIRFNVDGSFVEQTGTIGVGYCKK
jgi:hypothetical protein